MNKRGIKQWWKNKKKSKVRVGGRVLRDRDGKKTTKLQHAKILVYSSRVNRYGETALRISWNSVLTRITCRLSKEKRLDKDNLVQLHFKRPSHMIQIPIYTILFSLLLSGIICTLNFHRFVIFFVSEMTWEFNLPFFSQIGNQLCQHLLLNNSSPHHCFQTPT